MFAQGFIVGFNHLLNSESWARDRLKSHAGRTARLQLPPMRLTFVVNRDGTVAEAAAKEVDVEIAFPARSPLLALRGREAVLKEATLVGSAGFIEDLGFVLRNLRWDYEDDLSRVIGDIPAHRVAQLIQRLSQWQGDALTNLGENVAEFLRDEKQALVSHSMAGEFNQALEALRNDLSRLENRISRLSGHITR